MELAGWLRIWLRLSSSANGKLGTLGTVLGQAKRLLRSRADFVELNLLSVASLS